MSQYVKEYYNRGGRILKDGTVIGLKGNAITGAVQRGGYLTTGFSVDGVRKNIRFHQLQAYEKYGDKIFEEGIQVRHLNGDPSDNSWDNIAIGNQSDNRMDISEEIRMISSLIATSHVRRKDWDVIDKDRESGMSYGELQDKYGISKGTLSYRYSKTGKRTRKTDL